MSRKHLPPPASPSSDDDPQPREIGYKRPPVAHRFKKGVSGNPRGRPKGARNKRPALFEERLKTIILEEAYRTIKVTEGGKSLTMSMAQAIVRAQAVNGARGQLRSGQAFMTSLAETERANKAAYEQCLEAAHAYKADWERELERRRQTGETGPEPRPHPDDVVVDMRTGAVTIRGPMTEDDKANRNRMPLAHTSGSSLTGLDSNPEAITRDAAHALLLAKRLRAAKPGGTASRGEAKIETRTMVRREYKPILDVSKFSEAQLDVLEEALRVTVTQLEATDKTIEHEWEEAPRQ